MIAVLGLGYAGLPLVVDFLLVAIPTPVTDAKIPDVGPLLGACRSLGPNLKRGATAIFESTVYPGATEEVCIPEIERCSGLAWQRDFHVGYSPERINPGDRAHGLTQVVKVAPKCWGITHRSSCRAAASTTAWESTLQSRPSSR